MVSEDSKRVILKEKRRIISDFRKILKWRGLTLISAIFISASISTNTYLLVPNYTLVMDEFNVSNSFMGIISGSYYLVLGLSTIFWGYIVDLIRRRKPLLFSALIGSGCLTALTSKAPSAISLFILVVTTAFLLGALPPAIYGIFTDTYKAEERVKIFSAWSFFGSVGSAIGFALGLFMGYFSGWRSAFLFGAIPLLISSLLVIFISEPPKGAAEVELQDVIYSGLEYSFRIKKEDIIEFLSKKMGIILVIQGLLVTIPWGAYTTWGMHFVSRELGANTIIATLLLGLINLGGIVTIPMGFYLDKLYKKKPEIRIKAISLALVIAPLLLNLALTIFPRLNIHDNEIPILIGELLSALTANRVLDLAIIFGFIGVFFSSLHGPIKNSVVADVTPPENRASIYALIGLFELMGRGISIVMVGIFADIFGSIRLALLCAISIWIPTSVIWLLAREEYIKRYLEVKILLINRRESMLQRSILKDQPKSTQ
ncbi:MAG: MFS transporter [Candidatus Njordarchaeia archaeon]|nr:MFS transporter [Candidatus Korarchaeota archaeon]